MLQKENRVSISETVILFLVVSNALILKTAFVNNEKWYWSLIITLPLLLISIIHVRKKARLYALSKGKE
jgi:hypothetical protein